MSITVFTTFADATMTRCRGRYGAPDRAHAEAAVARALADRPNGWTCTEARIVEGRTLGPLEIVRRAKRDARWRLRNPYCPTYWAPGEAEALTYDDELAIGIRCETIRARYVRFCHHVREISPAWREVSRSHYADNSIEATQVSRSGATRTVMVEAPHGDVCF